MPQATRPRPGSGSAGFVTGSYYLWMECFGFSFGLAVAREEVVADNTGDVEYEYRKAEYEYESRRFQSKAYDGRRGVSCLT